MTNKTNNFWKEIEKRIDNELLAIFEKDTEEAYLMFVEFGWERKLKSFIKETLSAQKQEIKEMMILPKMDYLKWQLRTDLTDNEMKTGSDAEKYLEEYTNKARGWNKYRERIEDIIKNL